MEQMLLRCVGLLLVNRFGDLFQLLEVHQSLSAYEVLSCLLPCDFIHQVLRWLDYLDSVIADS